ncbi:MAG: response regulator transcription factor [Acidobacteria bacterium]|nr:response regulator transcription factor [Acidobacteriota bacterium]
MTSGLYCDSRAGVALVPEARIRIMIAEDHPVVREGLAAMIAKEPGLVLAGSAEDGSQAVELYRRSRPDIALMDLRMPGKSGVEATREILAEFPAARIIILSTYDGDEHIYGALKAGARSYLLKDMRLREMVEVIHAVHRGERRLPPAVAANLAERIPGEDLTAREREVLALLARGMSNKQIGAALGIAASTAKGFVMNIMGKLGAADRTEAVTIALRRGLVRIK